MSTCATGTETGLRHAYAAATNVAASTPENQSLVHVIDAAGSPDVYRDATRLIVAAQPCFYRSPQEFLARAQCCQPGCLIIRLRDDGETVRALQQELANRSIELPIIVTADGVQFSTAVELMERGAVTVMQHPPQPTELGRYIATAIQQHRSHRQLATDYQAISQTLRGLTDRQRRTLELANQGLPNKRIATALDVSVRTVEVDRSKILRAFNTRSLSNVTRQLGELKMLCLWHSHWRWARPRMRPQQDVRGRVSPK